MTMGYRRNKQVADQFSAGTIRKNAGRGRVRVRDYNFAPLRD
jgi:hypothetical protein